MFGRHIDFEYDDTVLIKRVEDLNVDSEQLLTHINCLIDYSNCLVGVGLFALNTKLFYGLLNWFYEHYSLFFPTIISLFAHYNPLAFSYSLSTPSS